MINHNELLETIDFLPLDGLHAWMQPALRAIVELHKPYGIDDYPKLKSYCTHCEHLQSQIWPCPTIQAIAKELA